MQRQNIFSGVKLLSNRNVDNNISKNLSRNQRSDELISIKQNAVFVKSRQNFKVFKFDSCLDKNSSQQEIYDNFGLTIVEDFINGYDCTLIICGQNSIKHPFTDIVLGRESQQAKGLLPRMIEQIRNSIRYFSERKFLIKVSFLQVSSQQMIDLLAVKKCKLQIKQQKSNNCEFYVSNLQIKPIKKVDDLESFYLIANRKRDYAYSKGQRNRENSTGFFTIYLESVEENGSIYRQSRFTICELAQSVFEECDSVGERKQLEVTLEHKLFYSNHAKRINYTNYQTNINLSNCAFLNVINTLVYGDQHITVPYKDSKVTKLLRSALGGTHKASILGIIDPSKQISLSKNLKILKTLQIAALIQNSPTNIKHTLNPQIKITIVDLLSQIQKLYNQLNTNKINLHTLQNNENYAAQELQKICQKNQYSLIKDNEFCSQTNLQDHFLQQKAIQISEKKQSIKDIEKQLKQKTSCIQNLSNEENHIDRSEVNFARQESVISKRKEILMRIRNLKEKRLNSIQSLEMSQTDRQKKRELFALEIEFNKEKSLYLSRIRQLQERLSLYKKLAENTLRPSEIEIIRTNSKYDESKREYDIPLFMVKDRKIRTRNMVSRSISEKKFLVSPRSFSFNSIHSNSDNNKCVRPLQIKKKTINDPNSLLTKIIQNDQQSKFQYQIQNKVSLNIKRKKILYTDSSSISRKKSPSTPITNHKNQALMTKIINDEHIKKVVSDYQMGDIDIDRVKQYNQQRKISKSKEKNEIIKGVTYRNPNNFLRRQKLNTQPSNREEFKQRKQILSPQRDYFPKSPQLKTKKMDVTRLKYS